MAHISPLTREKNIKLIERVSRHKCLWNKTANNYLKRDDIDKAWQSIARHSTDTVAHCRVRWTAIRLSFIESRRAYNPFYLAPHLGFIIPFLPNTHPTARPTLKSPKSIKKAAAAMRFMFAVELDERMKYKKHLAKLQRAQDRRELKIFNRIEIIRLAVTEDKDRMDFNMMYLNNIVPFISEMSYEQTVLFRRGTMDVIDDILDNIKTVHPFLKRPLKVGGMRKEVNEVVEQEIEFDMEAEYKRKMKEKNKQIKNETKKQINHLMEQVFTKQYRDKEELQHCTKLYTQSLITFLNAMTEKQSLGFMLATIELIDYILDDPTAAPWW